MEHFHHILIVLVFSVAVISIVRRMHLPPILGYLFVGVLAGPGGIKFIPSVHDLELLAEFGVVFLMFTLGLEFSIPRLFAIKKVLLGVGGMQVLLTTITTMIFCKMFGMQTLQSFLLGGVFALSSTAVVIKQLSDQNESQMPHGRLAISILLFQDIAAIIFLILIPALGSTTSESLTYIVSLALLKGVAVVVVLALIGWWFLRPLFHEVAKARSNELFMLATLSVALSAAWITHELLSSFALGAFIAGLMLGETEFKHQIEIDIRPFRDVLLGLFFITIGGLLNIPNVLENFHSVAIILAGIILGKTLIIFVVCKLFTKSPLDVCLRAGLVLSQGGEFGFVLLNETMNYNLIQYNQRQIMIASIVLSIVIAPFIIRFNQLACCFIKFFTKDSKETQVNFSLQQSNELTTATAEMEGHVIICGFGRVGQILSRFLEQENIPTVALDLDPVRLSQIKMSAERAFYGDARHPETLAAAGLSRARMLVTSFSNESAVMEVLTHVRSLRLDLPVFIRTRDDANLEMFQQAGATEVVPESLEGSLMLASHLLLTLGVPTTRVISKIRNIHANRYRILQGYYKGEDDLESLEDSDEARQALHSVLIEEQSCVIGKTLETVFNEYECYPIKLIRDNKKYPEPDPSMVIHEGDVLVFTCTPEKFCVIEEHFMKQEK